MPRINIQHVGSLYGLYIVMWELYMYILNKYMYMLCTNIISTYQGTVYEDIMALYDIH